MPDVSMVQQALNHSTPSDRYKGASSTFLPPLDDVAMSASSQVLNGTFTPRFGIQTTFSRSQPQVVQFPSSGTSSIFDCPTTAYYDRSPRLHLYPTKVNSPCRQPIKTPVMHPNLVCTLKSILSPKIEFDTQTFTSSGDSRCTHSENSPVPEIGEVQGSFEERINALAADNSSSKTASPESSSWPNMEVSEKSKLLQQEAVLVPVDLIQNRRPYQCAFTGCQRTFKNPQTMRMHHKTHFNDAAAAKLGAEAMIVPGSSPLKAGHNKKIPSRCPTCYKTFVGLYELRRHFGRKHSEGEKRHACRKCGKRFHIEVDVRDHEKLCGEPIVCSCGMKFAFKCNLVAHKRSHPKCQDRPTMEENGVTMKTPENNEQRKRRKFSETFVQNPLKLAETIPAMQTSSQLSPVQPFAILDSASASTSPFSSTTSSPSTSFVAEALPDFDVTSNSSLDYHYSSLSSGLLQADSYIKFPLDHYFLAYQAAPQRGAQ
ncbi:hypothetical protein KC19_7G030100 [Ceratodon purpureus]|uniref:C2H2-type domain-containing protein n=1 Tax=Ceratodon purpureus TaxID=3225 RepID=A0A8T0H5M8_CERPU|nr:hypothetical protein KC19_7G030100 [Ceratodon purpureus]